MKNTVKKILAAGAAFFAMACASATALDAPSELVRVVKLSPLAAGGGPKAFSGTCSHYGYWFKIPLKKFAECTVKTVGVAADDKRGIRIETGASVSAYSYLQEDKVSARFNVTRDGDGNYRAILRASDWAASDPAEASFYFRVDGKSGATVDFEYFGGVVEWQVPGSEENPVRFEPEESVDIPKWYRTAEGTVLSNEFCYFAAELEAGRKYCFGVNDGTAEDALFKMVGVDGRDVALGSLEPYVPWSEMTTNVTDVLTVLTNVVDYAYTMTEYVTGTNQTIWVTNEVVVITNSIVSTNSPGLPAMPPVTNTVAATNTIISQYEGNVIASVTNVTARVTTLEPYRYVATNVVFAGGCREAWNFVPEETGEYRFVFWGKANSKCVIQHAVLTEAGGGEGGGEGEGGEGESEGGEGEGEGGEEGDGNDGEGGEDGDLEDGGDEGDGGEAEELFAGLALGVFNGVALDGDEAMAGTVEVRAAKAKSGGTSAVTAAVKVRGGKLLKFTKGELRIGESGVAFVPAKTGEELELEVFADGFEGTFRDGAGREYALLGIRNRLTCGTAAEKAAAKGELAKWTGMWAAALESDCAEDYAGGMSVMTMDVKATGKVKLTWALSDGTQHTQTVTALVEEDMLTAPFEAALYTGKKGGFAGMALLGEDGEAELAGMTEWDASCRKGGGFTAEFGVVEMGREDFAGLGAELEFSVGELGGDAEWLWEFLPSGVPVAKSGNSLKAAAAGNVKWVKAEEAFLDVKESGNPGKASLKYSKGTGMVTGTFKAYEETGAGKMKAHSGQVRMVAIGGAAYGWAGVKGIASNNAELAPSGN